MVGGVSERRRPLKRERGRGKKKKLRQHCGEPKGVLRARIYKKKKKTGKGGKGKKRNRRKKKPNGNGKKVERLRK